nr:ATP-dependent DNA helicase PIF1-like [Coffea arabica]
MAQLIIECKLFLWDEASMAKRDTIQAFDELLKDLMETSDPFGGKVVVFGGDFRQTLPVIQGATKDQLIQASLLHSSLWSCMHKIKLKHNMRAVLDPAFSRFLLAVGEGAEPVDADNQICLPGHMVIPFHNIKDSLDRFLTKKISPRLIAYTFPDLNLYSSNPYEMISRCILTPKNTSVEDINEMMIQRFPGQLFTYTSSDQTVDQRFQLKDCAMAQDLFVGSSICAEIAFGQYKGKKIFIPRIPLQTPDNEKNGIPFIRRQFPVRLCFAMTINKAQGQTLDYVGVYLKEPVFSHGQLYVALSRAKTADAVKVLILPGTFAEIKTDCKTRNIVFDEILQLSN